MSEREDIWKRRKDGSSIGEIITTIAIVLAVILVALFLHSLPTCTILAEESVRVCAKHPSPLEKVIWEEEL